MKLIVTNVTVPHALLLFAKYSLLIIFLHITEMDFACTPVLSPFNLEVLLDSFIFLMFACCACTIQHPAQVSLH